MTNLLQQIVVVKSGIEITATKQQLIDDYGFSKSECEELFLSLAKKTAKTQINRARDERISGGLEYPSGSGHVYQTDDASRLNISGAFSMAMAAAQSSTVFKMHWGLADNSVVTLSAADVIGMGLAVGEHVAHHIEAARDAKGRIEEATDESVIDAILSEY